MLGLPVGFDEADLEKFKNTPARPADSELSLNLGPLLDAAADPAPSTCADSDESSPKPLAACECDSLMQDVERANDTIPETDEVEAVKHGEALLQEASLRAADQPLSGLLPDSSALSGGMGASEKASNCEAEEPTSGLASEKASHCEAEELTGGLCPDPSLPEVKGVAEKASPCATDPPNKCCAPSEGEWKTSPLGAPEKPAAMSTKSFPSEQHIVSPALQLELAAAWMLL